MNAAAATGIRLGWGIIRNILVWRLEWSFQFPLQYPYYHSFPKTLGQTCRYSLKSLSLTTDNDEQLRSPLVTVGNRWFVVTNSFKLLRSWVCVCKCAMMLNIQYVFRNFESSQKLDWSSEPVDRQLVVKSSQIHWFWLDFYNFFCGMSILFGEKNGILTDVIT